jgi:hypothetical protein
LWYASAHINPIMTQSLTQIKSGIPLKQYQTETFDTIVMRVGDVLKSPPYIDEQKLAHSDFHLKTVLTTLYVIN